MPVAKTIRRMQIASGVALGLCLAGCAANPDPGVDSTLDAWRQTGNVAWRFSDNGAAAGPAAPAGYLVSPEQYRGLTLVVEFWIEDDTNSGIFVRCQDPERITPDNCYEVNIWDNHPVQDFRTGSIVKRQLPLAHVDSLLKWTECRITLKRESLIVMMNDVVTARLEDANLAEGFIALQYAGKGEVRFRNLRLLVDE